MRAISPVLPGTPVSAVAELRIAEDQPEYETLPALPCDDGVILTRWEFEDGERERFERGAAVNLYVLHGAGGAASDHRIESGEPEPRPPMLTEPWEAEPQDDPRFSLFAWRPFEAERTDVLQSGSVWLFQWTGGQSVQPLALLVGEVGR